MDQGIPSRFQDSSFTNYRRLTMPKGMLGNSEVLRRIMSGPFADLAVKLNSEDSDEWEAALGTFLRKEPTWVGGAVANVEKVKPPTLVLIQTATLGKIEGKETRSCFAGAIWGYRDSDIDRWFPARQIAQTAGSVGVYQLQNPKGTAFREMALAALKASPDTSNDQLAKMLKERGLTFTIQAIERLVERQESGEDVGLRTDGYANLAFAEDANGSVSVLRVGRSVDGWGAYVYRFGDGGRWRAEYRLLLRNSVTATL
ncbi:hypothetical protein HZC00_02825 [Candidatus Kaiserbacteria bacterium]|nr:hypothetical protein [Candidatus Kaiserbacteria bacterium]